MTGEPTAASPDTGLAGLRHGVAIRGDYGVTCSCTAVLDWPKGWARNETAAERLVWTHAGECLACHRPWPALAAQVPEPSLDAAWREAEAVIAAARRVSEVSVTVEAVRVAYGTPKTGSDLFMALGELDYAIGALDNATRLRATTEAPEMCPVHTFVRLRDCEIHRGTTEAPEQPEHVMGPPRWEPGDAQDEWTNRCLGCGAVWTVNGCPRATTEAPE